MPKAVESSELMVSFPALLALLHSCTYSWLAVTYFRPALKEMLVGRELIFVDLADQMGNLNAMRRKTPTTTSSAYVST